MLIRHETTPGYAQLVRRRRGRRRLTERIASGIVVVGLLGAFAAAMLLQPGLPTTFALGAGLVLYALASFGLEEPPRKAQRAPRPMTRRPVPAHRRPIDDEIDWEALEEPVAG